MFADISGFTPLTEKMSKLGRTGIEKMTAYLNKFFDRLIGMKERIIKRNILVLVSLICIRNYSFLWGRYSEICRRCSISNMAY